MDSPGTDRGQALQVGAILLFGILILFLTIYQATAVPAQNKRVEFDSYLEATSDMENVRNDVRYVASRDAVAGTTVKTGAEYPARVVFVNPGPPATRLRTVDSGSFTVSNASAVESEAAGTRAFWDGSSRSYETKGLRLDTDYNELQVPSVVYEPGVIYRPANDSVEPPYGPDEVILLSGQSVLEGDRLTLVSVAGRVDAGGRRTLVTTEPKSAHTRTVVVENDTGNVTVTVPSSLSAETWDRSLLADQQDPGDAVVAVRNNTSTPGYDAVDIVLGPGSYQLRLAKVEVRQEADSSSVADPKPAYVVGTAGDEASLSRDQRVRLTAEVRDRFNNPKSGEEVLFRTADGAFATGGSSTTVAAGGEGQASALFEPDRAGTLTVRAGLDVNDDGDVTAAGDGALNVTTFTVYVSESTSPQYSLQWDQTAIESDGQITDCYSRNDTCLYDMDGNSQITVDLTATTSPQTSFASVDFATNDTTVVSSLTPEEESTSGSTGEASTQATVEGGGTAAVFASSVESGDMVLLKPGGGGAPPADPGPSGPRAYDDANNNGQYDSGESTYTNSELQNGFTDSTVDLVIPSDVGSIVNGNNLEIEAGSINSDVDLRSDNNNLILTATDGTVDISGVSATSGSNNVQISGNTVVADNAVIEANSNSIEIDAQEISITGATVSSGNSVYIRATQNGGGQLDATGASLEAPNNQLVLRSRGDMFLDDATLISNQATASLGQGSNTLYVEGASIEGDDTLEYDPNGISVVGDPENGSVVQ